MAAHGRRLDIGGLAFRAIESQRPAGSTAPAAVLIHGIGASHRYLARLHEALNADTAVVSIDLPGFGGLPKPAGDIGIPKMSAALGEVIAALGHEQVVLVGHSMGAQWAIETAVQRPERVSMVVAIGPVADDRHRTPLSQARALALDTLGETPSINAIVFTDYLRCGAPWYQTQLRHMLAYPTEDKAAALMTPLLVMRGGRDPVAGRDWCRRIAARTPVARFVEIPGGHHVVQQSSPRAVASAILIHATRLWSRR
ncbi:alpha/beta fold hydrolase [Microbacterium sp. ZW T6_19]|uniref:alpha/beta fold hydrolase n=1 Tax=Microbacterium sp. ZW T6_19 TaxID=3378082 RepID=UPI0038547024